MSYVVAKDNSVSFLHLLHDLAGTALLSGKVTPLGLAYTITAPDGTQTTTGLTWTEPNTDGNYLAAKTYGVVGAWHIKVDHEDTAPGGVQITGSDLGVYDYYVQVVTAAAGVVPSGSYLTSLANLKESLGITDASQDTYLNNLIARSTQTIERMVGRELVSATYTEYHDGGARSLLLKRGPIQSVTSVSLVTYDGDGAETLAAQAGGNYFSYGLNADNWKLRGRLEWNTGRWMLGQRLWKVIYVAGFSTVPFDLEQACLDVATWFYNQRKDIGNAGRAVVAESISFRPPGDMRERMDNFLMPYMDMRAAA